MAEYENNSIKNKENKKTVEKVVKGDVKTKKKSELYKIANSIVAEEAKDVKDYVIYDVLVPVIKDTISDLIKGTIDMLLYGKVSGRSSSRHGGNYSRVSYRDYYDDKRSSRRDDDRRSRALRYSYDDLTFDCREDAEEVLSSMDDIIEQYDVVTVADLFDLAGVSGNGYTDQNYGWTNLSAASVMRTRTNEYIIKLPRPCSIR